MTLSNETVAANRECSLGHEDIDEPIVDPIEDIIDYLLRIAKVNVGFNGLSDEPSTSAKKNYIHEIFKKSVVTFLMKFGKYLAYNHLSYFESIPYAIKDEKKQCLSMMEDLKQYLSEEGTKKRVRNRRYTAMLKLQKNGDYFSEKEMMYRNPLLYDQLIGQYLTNEEIALRDQHDSETLTLSSMILDTVDQSYMRELKQAELEVEKKENTSNKVFTKRWGEFIGENSNHEPSSQPRWGASDNIYENSCKIFNERRKEKPISATERILLKDEFYHEMYNSFLEGHDDFDYATVDGDETLDNLQILDRDKEERYFDSEPMESNNLEESMALAHEYGKKESKTSDDEDELDVFMKHLRKHPNLQS